MPLRHTNAMQAAVAHSGEELYSAGAIHWSAAIAASVIRSERMESWETVRFPSFQIVARRRFESEV